MAKSGKSKQIKQDTKRQPKKGVKTAKTNKNPDGWRNLEPVWKFSKHDKSTTEFHIKKGLDVELFEKLVDYEGYKWNDIITTSGGNNHFIQASSLNKEARSYCERFQIEEVMSLRLTGKKRLFGTMSQNVFSIIWYDPEHKICPSIKKHT